MCNLRTTSSVVKQEATAHIQGDIYSYPCTPTKIECRLYNIYMCWCEHRIIQLMNRSAA